ncbi:Alcohol O-acetyltransferase [Bertholletia excelsa]
MIVDLNFPASYLKSSLTPHPSLVLIRRRTLRVRDCLVWRSGRIKFNRSCVVCGQSDSSSVENFFQNLISQFPSLNSLDLTAPALGFASGAALYLSRFNPRRVLVPDVGKWILLTSPTPFNRFVMLRCPSIGFEGSEFLEDVNERLVKEDRHLVRLDSGRIQVSDLGDEELVEKLVYQRVCVSTDDGGVISLDWPANLDLREERGLDTTLLLIPGTAEGSMEKNIRWFVVESLKRGCFPVVMNPRGCAGSPLTTARLFTAADSDDICTAIQFINKARPWTTLMGVGWGYGANMLTKHLAEVGEKTPLIAATCINNPFDLEELTTCSPHHFAFDQKLTGGLVGILQSNKELFRGRSKGFDVEKALLAKSVRDFEKAISMISYGFDAIEDFYAESSTGGVIGNVKIPVLFIQNDDGTMPLFSIPRSSIAENPFTSLLLCSCLPSGVTANAKSAICWYQHLTIEWLGAVELGLLKGRHPLLKDVDVTVNPSIGLAVVEGRTSDKNYNKFLNHSQPGDLKDNVIKETVEENEIFAANGSKFRNYSQKNPGTDDKGVQEEHNGAIKYTSSIDAEIAKEEASPIDYERGQVLQATELIMNMLDVTMPGTLTGEQKKEVLAAVGQGETVMKALQDAVPDDVCGKLTSAVTEILQNKGTSLKLEGLLNIAQIPILASGLKSKTQEEVVEPSDKDSHPSDHRNKIDDLAETLDKSQTANHHHENLDTSTEKAAQYSEHNENESDTDVAADCQRQAEKDGGAGEEDNMQQNIEKVKNSSTDQNKAMQSTKTEEGLSNTASSDVQSMEKESTDYPKKDEKSMPSVPSQSSSNPSTFSVSQALDALTGMDDSTQVAVNSVFGVIEDMITQLEEERDSEAELDDEIDIDNRGTDSTSQNHQILIDNDDSMSKEEIRNDLSSESANQRPEDFPLHEVKNAQTDARARSAEKQMPIRSTGPCEGNTDRLKDDDRVSLTDSAGNETREQSISSKLSVDYSSKTKHVYSIPPCITINPYADPLYKEYSKYLLSEMPNTKTSELDKNPTFFLDYCPEEHQWKLLEQSGNNGSSAGYISTHEGAHKVTPVHPSISDKVIEPPYVIMDADQESESIQEYDTEEKMNQMVTPGNYASKLMSFVKNIILDSLKIEVSRRLSAASIKEMEPHLAREMEIVANAVCLAAGHGNNHVWFLDGDLGEDCSSEKVDMLNGEQIVQSISSAVQETSYLKRLLPVGVVVGSSLASLRKFFDVAAVNNIDQTKEMDFDLDQINLSVERDHGQQDLLVETDAGQVHHNNNDQDCTMCENRDGEVAEPKKLNSTAMVGAVTAALGASALLVHQQGMKDSDKDNETSGNLSKPYEEKEIQQKEPDEKDQNNIITSLAEKAISVAGPVVPVKEDGGVDQERLVAMLAELGQRGGVLKLVGKLALLWGGLRGAMSLTDKLISFLRIAERPLLHRILGFVCMVLLLWSPIVVPLLPTLVQSWATNSSSSISELICIVGLYVSIIILIMLWGKRIRGYKNPSEQYGLDITSSLEIKNLLKGLVGGVMLVLSVQSLNTLLGCTVYHGLPLLFHILQVL